MDPTPHPAPGGSVAAMWRAYHASRGTPPDAVPQDVPSLHFCDNRHDADLCAALVLQGCKRATSPSVWELTATGAPVPRVGDLHVVTNWDGEAQCVIRTVEVTITPFHSVTAEHAAAEGEGDGSLAFWRRVHRDYYARVLAGTEYEPREDMPIVCERFEVVYPPAG